MSASTIMIDTARLTVWLILLTLVFASIERLFALRERPGKRHVIADVGYFYLNGFVPTAVLAVPLAALAGLTRAMTPASYTHWVASLPLWAAIPAGLIVAELGSYAVHRWCHRSPYLWQFHAIHHTPDHLDWMVNTRAHPVDIVLTRLGALLPLYLLGLDASGHTPGLTPVLVTIIGTFWAFMIHANVRWRFGWLEQVVATPAFHHWHHTNDEHRDRNFAATLPIVDRLFGTLHLPDHWPPVYGIDRPVAPTLHDELVRPFSPPTIKANAHATAEPLSTPVQRTV